MKNTASLHRLRSLSTLILDQHLAKLQAAAAERRISLQRLQDLTPIPAKDLDDVTRAATLMRYERWADKRRRDINLVLAQQTATWMEARGKAQAAFGRADVLMRLAKSAKKP